MRRVPFSLSVLERQLTPRLQWNKQVEYDLMPRTSVVAPCFLLLAILSGCGDVGSSQKQDVAELRRLPNNFAIDVNEAGEVIKVSVTYKTGIRYIGGSPPITDEALLRISAIPTIRELHIPSGLNIHDAGFSHLKKLQQLEILTIVRGPHITDEGLRHLSELAAIPGLQEPPGFLGCFAPGFRNTGSGTVFLDEGNFRIITGSCQG